MLGRIISDAFFSCPLGLFLGPMAKANGQWKWFDEKIQNKMTDEFLSYYGKNILHESKLINGVKEFLNWCNNENISMAVCTNKTEHLAVDLLKKIGIYEYFEYVAGYNTFEYCKPDPRHLTNVIEILDGDKNKSLMIGDSETDANAAKAADIPIILLKYGYTEKRSDEIYHNIDTFFKSSLTSDLSFLVFFFFLVAFSISISSKIFSY